MSPQHLMPAPRRVPTRGLFCEAQAVRCRWSDPVARHASAGLTVAFVAGEFIGVRAR